MTNKAPDLLSRFTWEQSDLKEMPTAQDAEDIEANTFTESALLEAGFTGQIKDKNGATLHYVQGKRVKGQAEYDAKKKAPTKAHDKLAAQHGAAMSAHKDAGAAHGDAQSALKGHEQNVVKAAHQVAAHHDAVGAAAQAHKEAAAAAKGGKKVPAEKKAAAVKAKEHLATAKAAHKDSVKGLKDAVKGHKTATTAAGKHEKADVKAGEKLKKVEDKIGPGDEEPPVKAAPKKAPAKAKAEPKAKPKAEPKKKAAPKEPETKKAEPEPAAAPKAEHHARVLAAVDATLDKNNYMNMADLKSKLPAMSTAEFHATIHDLRKQGVLSLASGEGRHGFTDAEQAAGVREEGSLLLWASVKDEDKFRQLAGGGKTKPAEPKAAEPSPAKKEPAPSPAEKPAEPEKSPNEPSKPKAERLADVEKTTKMLSKQKDGVHENGRYAAVIHATYPDVTAEQYKDFLKTAWEKRAVGLQMLNETPELDKNPLLKAYNIEYGDRHHAYTDVKDPKAFAALADDFFTGDRKLSPEIAAKFRAKAAEDTHKAIAGGYIEKPTADQKALAAEHEAKLRPSAATAPAAAKIDVKATAALYHGAKNSTPAKIKAGFDAFLKSDPSHKELKALQDEMGVKSASGYTSVIVAELMQAALQRQAEGK